MSSFTGGVEGTDVQPPGDNRGSATSLSDLLTTDKEHTVRQDDSECGHHSDSADSW